MKKVLSVFLALLICVSIIPLGTLRTEALSPSYSVSSYYASGSYYTALCNVSLTGNQRTDIANVAKSQVGYHEGNSDGDMNGNNTSGSNNYCEYNYWYYGGAHNGGADYAWCAVFISWCASQAQISTSIVKKNAWAGGSGATFGGTKQLFSSGYTPQAGDIVHINNDSDSDSDHVGLIYAVDSSYIYTVEGNASNKVVQYKYSRSNGKLNGTSSTSIIFYEVPSYTNSEPTTAPTVHVNNSLSTPGEATILTWEGETINNYWLHIYCNGDTVINQAVSGNSFQYSFYTEGEYCAYVASYSSNGKELVSNGCNFYVYSNPDKPIIYGLSKQYNFKETADFSWSSPNYAPGNYWLHIYKDGETIVNEEVIGNSYKFSNLNSGNYTAFVVAYSLDYSREICSDAYDFTVLEPEKPIISSSSTSYNTGDDIVVNWNSPNYSKNDYWIHIYKDGEDFINESVSGNQFVIKNAETGRYVFFIAAYTKDNSCEICSDAYIINVYTNITRLSGATRYDTAVAISNQGWESADTVILANGTNYADALAGVPLAYKLNAPILLTENWGDIESNVAAQIENLGASKVIILGGYKVVSQQIEDTLSEKYTVERIKGSTRYDTAVEISKRVSANPKTAIVVTGTGYADALSISPYAAMKGYPIVYTDPATGLTDSTVNYLSSAKDIIIIGGYKVVRENTVAQLEGKNIDRIYGSSRYLTSYEIANKFSSEFGNDVMLATGTSFPDALTGGVLAAKLKTPLLLTEKPAVIDEIKNFILDKSPSNIYILGGEKAMPTSIVENIYA